MHIVGKTNPGYSSLTSLSLPVFIQTTVNMKKVELPVKQIISGKTVKPSGTLLNPQSLDYYYQFARVEELVDQLKAKL